MSLAGWELTNHSLTEINVHSRLVLLMINWIIRFFTAPSSSYGLLQEGKNVEITATSRSGDAGAPELEEFLRL